MIGKSIIEMPKTVGDCIKIHRLFDIKRSPAGNAGNYIFNNARRLVELNNEVYHTLCSMKGRSCNG